MLTPITSCSNIEQAVLNRLTTTLTGVRAAATQKDAVGLYPGPTVSVAVLEGTFEELSAIAWSQKVAVHVLVSFKHERGEEERRRGVNPLVQGVIQTLLLQNLDLGMDPLQPVRFREVTDEDDYEARTIVYLVEFATSFPVIKVVEEELGPLLKHLTLADNLGDTQEILSP